ncbi:amidohydrolase family protein [Achromobacter xylosoxidans]|uniref:Amidohydrolase family protein n=1 Tax=Alcaligenes xylosoxydans xylosoxydans TaxID=85698 RepID=A0A9X3R5U8_ALCXX|nr:amidohydrolase family protein [Achromobacter xylosoxidans]MCZ8404026.1 amidohydrolase family protein [Achromobacter xylosoxidans]
MSAAPLPADACDCHVHVVAPQADYPMLPERHYTPGPASVDALRTHMARLGLARAVIVQPSIYGTDNRLLIDSLAALNGAARGVAVLEAGVADGELGRLHDAGVRGLRVNLESTGDSAPDAVGRALSTWAGRLAGQGWHIQIYASLDAIAAAAPVLGRLAVPVVLDHFAMIPSRAPLDDPRVRRVLDLVGDGRAYVKLSASYRVCDDPDDAALAAGVAALARAIVRRNPERALWASDWPHTNREPGRRPTEVSAYRAVAAARLAGELDAWLPDAAQRRQVLAVNPAALYGFQA